MEQKIKRIEMADKNKKTKILTKTTKRAKKTNPKQQLGP
jgi:hypothetical protein